MSGSMAHDHSAGFVYVAFGEPYLEEMAVSCQTLRTHNPTARICLITDEAGKGYVTRRHPALSLDQIRCVAWQPSQESFWVLRTKIFELSPYQKTIYLDDDTYVAGPIEDLFDLLETFDFVAVPDESHPARGFILGMRGGYAALNYYNCGFFMFRKSAAARQLFENWRQEYLALAPLEPADQGALVRALVNTDLRFITLPKEYNLRLIDKCVSFQHRVKIIHGRARDPQKLIRMLNDITSISHGSRVWIPNVQRVIKATAFARYAHLLSLFNLDQVRRSALGQWERASVGKNLSELSKTLARRLTKTVAARAIPRGPHAARREGEPSPDPRSLEYLQMSYGIRSALLGRGTGGHPGLDGMPNVHLVHYDPDGSQPPLPVGSFHHDLRSGPYRAPQRYDLVWWDRVSEPSPSHVVRHLIETLTRNSARCLVLALASPGGPHSPTGYSHPSFQVDWSWTQAISDQGFYFEPYRTLKAREVSSDSDFKRTGMVFERATLR
ncbi:MAG: hypothetical protein HY595_04630 [Candidatus Omnitrophica bacterium]|nr:hypothetical protein [Candidatus Omnitrophota bacterium]